VHARPRTYFDVGSYGVVDFLYESLKTRIFRAVKGNQRFVVKALYSDVPTVAELHKIRHEYAVLKDLNIDGVAKVVQLESFGSGLALVLEDFDGITLREVWISLCGVCGRIQCVFLTQLCTTCSHIRRCCTRGA
jgi:L-rhamnose isomerase